MRPLFPIPRKIYKGEDQEMLLWYAVKSLNDTMGANFWQVGNMYLFSNVE